MSKRSASVIKDNARRKQRIEHPLWSCKYIEEDHAAIGGADDVFLCSGHCFEFALIYERIIVGGVKDKIVELNGAAPNHHLTKQEKEEFFNLNVVQDKTFFLNSNNVTQKGKALRDEVWNASYISID